uniref:procollagen-proline 4-dioxygenase n=1 Tax=Glossina brevipalpis TaxID=37001 RepID=A0A1A9WN34_9MUSC
MTSLLYTEKALLENLEMYIAKLEDKVDSLKILIDKLKADYLESLQDPEDYLSNPLNYFGLLRHMKSDWTNIDNYVLQPVGEEYSRAMTTYHMEMPDSIDLEEAIEGMHYLQTMYNLDVEGLSKGILNGRQYKARLSSLDMYTIGVQLFHEKHYFDTILWLASSILSYEDDSFNEIMDFDRGTILELYAEAYMQQNRAKEALIVLRTILRLGPSTPELLKRKDEVEFLAQSRDTEPYKYVKPQPTLYALGCSGKLAERPSKLYCTYNRNTTAFSRLAPMKMELISLDPYMVLYHEALTDNEIIQLKEMAIPHLERAKVFDGKTNREIIAKDRTSQIFLVPEVGEINVRLHYRVIDMTGLSMVNSEVFQILNYGIGGQNAPHFDSFNVSMTHEHVNGIGDRIASVLFYMSDVEEGGATVFPRIQKAIRPQKATALFWYNLNNEIETDPNTLHGGCPVLIGSKWVITKWIRSNAQMFIRRCRR